MPSMEHSRPREQDIGQDVDQLIFGVAVGEGQMLHIMRRLVPELR